MHTQQNASIRSGQRALRGHWLLGLSALALALPASSALAQAQDGLVLEEIIVTAQRRAENLQDVPVSVSAFTAAALEERGLTDISRLEGAVPGFSFARSGSDARPSMRGVRTDNVAINGDTTIGFFIDGIYQSRASQAMAGFVDIAQLEVQRGPQGTLYGRNTFGGNIVLTTEAPKLGTLEGGADLTLGSYGKVKTEGFINVPLGDNAAFRVAAMRDESDGWVKNDNPAGSNLFDDDSKYARASFKVEPTENFTVTARADYNEQGGAGGSAFGYKQRGTYVYGPTCQQLFNATPLLVNSRAGNRDGIADCTTSAGVGVDLGVPIYKYDDPYRIDTDYKTYLDLEKWSGSLDLAYELDGVTLKSITGYVDFDAVRTADSDFSGNTIAIDSSLTAAKTFSQEVQALSNGDGPLKWVTGLYYFHDKLEGAFVNQQFPRTIRTANGVLNLAPASGGTYDQQRATTKSLAGYAQASYAVTEKLNLTLGGRYTRDRKDFAFANANLILPLLTSATGVRTPDASAITLDMLRRIPDSSFGTRGTTNCTFAGAAPGFACAPYNTNVLTGASYDPKSFKEFTYRLAADYELADDHMLYGSYSTGFRSGGFNSGQAAAGLAPTFDPEKVKALEVGSKNRFLDNRLQLNLSFYYNWYSNLQEQRAVPVGGTTISGVFNAARARTYGLETELQWQVTSDFSLTGAFSVMDAEYTRFPDTPLSFGTTLLLANGTRIFAPGYDCGLVAGTTGTYGCNLSGKEIPHQPSWTGSVTAKYEMEVGTSGSLTPLATVTFSDGYYGTPFNSALDYQKGYAKLDLRLIWDVNEQYRLQAFVDNVTDKAVANRYVYGAGALQASYAPPRLWGVKGSVRF